MIEADRADSHHIEVLESRRVPIIAWVILFAVVAVWVADRAGAFDLWTTVRMADGREVRLPAVYGTVDHPFHATRAELVWRAIADGRLPRWIGSHQGGYPAEFYPLGVAGLEVAIRGLILGSLPMVLVHKLTVVLIFLAPGLAYALAAHRDRLPLGVGLVALAVQVVVRGWWWSGGFQELVEWGLVTNVAAAVAALFVLVCLTSYLHRGRGWDGALAALCGGFCLYSNPRSGIALAIAGFGAALAVGFSDRSEPGITRRIVGRLSVVAVAVALIAAPQIVSLLRFEHLYYFVQYQRYDDLAAYWRASIQAVSGPVFVVGLGGLVTGLVLPGRVIARSVAVTFALYCLVTAYLGVGSWPGQIVERLEPTRLMPFQRLLMVFLAAVAVHDLARWFFGRVAIPRGLAIDGVLIAGAVALPFLYVLSPPRWVPVGDRGLVEVPTAADPSIADLEEAVRVADAGAAPGTALLVLGSTVSWHSNLWAPLWSERPFFYDDWLWYWQTRHAGPYNPLTEHAYRPAEMAEVLTPGFLDEHGIGAVVVTVTARTEEAARAAASAPGLDRVRTGVYDVYLVRAPTTIVTFTGVNAESISVADQAVGAVGTSTGGTAEIRRNWFPRWRARVNGEAVPIAETEDGYMTVPNSSGRVEVDFEYVVDGWDWLARAMCVVGFAFVGWLVVPRGRMAKGWFRGT